MKNSRPVSDITVINKSGEINKNSGTYIVTGTAQNTGTTTIVKIYLVATTYDANGTLLGIDLRHPDEYESRGTCQFQDRNMALLPGIPGRTILVSPGL